MEIVCMVVQGDGNLKVTRMVGGATRHPPRLWTSQASWNSRPTCSASRSESVHARLQTWWDAPKSTLCCYWYTLTCPCCWSMRVSWHDGTPQQARSAAFGTPSHASCFEYSVPSGPLRTSGKEANVLLKDQEHAEHQCAVQGLASSLALYCEGIHSGVAVAHGFNVGVWRMSAMCP
eukprot:scaffold43042_cov20-Tisochrysis_lutea.AAC.1